MKTSEFLSFIHQSESLKKTMRHSWISDGRQESVAEHTWRMALMAMLLQDEFEAVNLQHLLQMVLVHDIGEIATGDIPIFDKTNADTQTELCALDQVLDGLPDNLSQRIKQLVLEYQDSATPEAKLCKALDKLEVLIQHNEAPLNTWLPLEFKLNLTHGDKQCAYDPYLKELRDLVRKESIDKINLQNQ